MRLPLALFLTVASCVAAEAVPVVLRCEGTNAGGPWTFHVLVDAEVRRVMDMTTTRDALMSFNAEVVTDRFNETEAAAHQDMLADRSLVWTIRLNRITGDFEWLSTGRDAVFERYTGSCVAAKRVF